MRRHAIRRTVEESILATRPVFYVPMQGNLLREVVRGVTVTNSPLVLRGAGPLPGHQAMRFSASTADDDALSVATNAAYHPGNTLSVGGWFNRLGAGDAAGGGAVMLHMGNTDFTVYFQTANDKISFRAAGVGDIFVTTRTFPTPYTDGWHHVIFAKNAGSSCVCYLDGVSTAGTYTNQTVTAVATNPTFGVSATNPTTLDFDGALAHWAIWNRVLTAGEVLDMYRDARRAA